jgi:hypothetical protein
MSDFDKKNSVKYWIKPIDETTTPKPTLDERREWRSPSVEETKTPIFNAIWDVIKRWDVNVPDQYEGYCGANGNHVIQIMESVNSAIAEMQAEIDLRTAQCETLIETNKKLREALEKIATDSMYTEDLPYVGNIARKALEGK